jgi:hypothetical protein
VVGIAGFVATLGLSANHRAVAAGPPPSLEPPAPFDTSVGGDPPETPDASVLPDSGEPTPAPGEPLPAAAEPPPAPSERSLTARYSVGFHWSLAPGVAVSSGKAAFSMGARFDYGFDTGSVIVVPGVDLAAFFLQPNVYVALPVCKLIMPVGWFAPFVEAGAGLGVEGSAASLAVLGGGGFAIRPSPSFIIGAEGSYETLIGTPFGAITFGPVFGLAF